MGNKEVRNDEGRIEGEGVGNQATPWSPNAQPPSIVQRCAVCGRCKRHCPASLGCKGQPIVQFSQCPTCFFDQALAPPPDGYSPQPPPNGWTAKTLSEALGQFPPDTPVGHGRMEYVSGRQCIEGLYVHYKDGVVIL
jgi:hypothetical protein